MDKKLKFVDLFAGLGGFHTALSKLGHTCVFASEIDPDLQHLYLLNHGLKPYGNIRDSWNDVPEHDILCAGFPCQPFSKAGSQLGFDCPTSGDLFKYILNIIDLHKPRFLLFENVPNILRHDNGSTWLGMRESLSERGYTVDFKELSPHQFGVPQNRNRAIIVASLLGLEGFTWPVQVTQSESIHLSSILDENPNNIDRLPPSYIKYLDVWEEFLDRIGDDNKLPSFPIWAMEFGATYPFADRSPVTYSANYLARYNGAFGTTLKGRSKGQQLAALPAYARADSNGFPRWKIRFIQQNREFFLLHKDRLESWLPKVQGFASSFQKFEWNWQEGDRTIWNKIVQFRASGIRVKNPATAPSLVALTTSQVPVVAWEKRYMSMRECARLQSLDELPFLPESKTRAFKALGNAVNVKVISSVATSLFNRAYDARVGMTESKSYCPNAQLLEVTP
jgi:DNA (cytosine-5)-methyltransferase 1